MAGSLHLQIDSGDEDLEAVSLKDVLEAARGPKYLGVRLKLLVFWGLHLSIVGGLLFTDTYLVQAFDALLRFRIQGSWYALSLLTVLALHAANYTSLFGSDPGWLPINQFEAPPEERCRFCNTRTRLRSRHDFKTGQCVLRFDHFCWALGTTIGDRNHFRFWLYNVVQTFLVLWGFALVFSRLNHCGARPMMGSCWSEEPWRIAGLFYMALVLYVALAVFGGLFLFHTYLATTNQTTFEVMKGEAVPYLQPYYAYYEGPKSVDFTHRPGLPGYLYRVVKGNGPPRPFSSYSGPFGGLGDNLNAFFFAQSMAPQRYSFQAPRL